MITGGLLEELADERCWQEKKTEIWVSITLVYEGRQMRFTRVAVSSKDKVDSV